MTTPLRLGTVPYLNALPLVEGLSGEPLVQLEQAVPSELARRLRAGALDAALLSSVELFREPPLTWVEGPAITSHGPVRSILLFLRGAASDVRRLALDRSSLSAAVLARVCLAEFMGVSDPEVTRCEPTDPLETIEADAVLRIGDPALRTAFPPGMRVLDLGALWTGSTGLPFVYALWVVHPGVPAQPLQRLVLTAREIGLERRDALAEGFARRQGVSEDESRSYLRENIGYAFGPDERRGLELYGRLAHSLGLVDMPELPEALPGEPS
jgi:chorismate dehydratase